MIGSGCRHSVDTPRMGPFWHSVDTPRIAVGFFWRERRGCGTCWAPLLRWVARRAPPPNELPRAKRGDSYSVTLLCAASSGAARTGGRWASFTEHGGDHVPGSRLRAREVIAVMRPRED